MKRKPVTSPLAEHCRTEPCFLKQYSDTGPAISVPALVNKFLERRTWDAYPCFIGGIRQLLCRFAQAFPGPFVQVSVHDINAYLNTLAPWPDVQDAMLSCVWDLLDLAKHHHYVPRDTPYAIIGCIRPKVQPCDPECLTTVLRAVPSELVVAITLSAFAGLRGVEILTLKVDDVDWENRQVFIESANVVGRHRRVIPMTPNLKEWLARALPKDGPVFSVKNAFKRIGAIATKHGVKCNPSFLRRSYIAYRVAATGSVDQVASEVGMSVDSLHMYFSISVTKEQADRWFSILPGKPSDTPPAMTPPKLTDSDSKQAIAPK
jgi:integrase